MPESEFKELEAVRHGDLHDDHEVLAESTNLNRRIPMEDALACTAGPRPSTLNVGHLSCITSS
jgi:hypothetical protein